MAERAARPGFAVSRYLARARLRTGWRFVVGAGARRTDSVFQRLADATRASDVLVLPNSSAAVVAVTPERLRALPGVDRPVESSEVLGYRSIRATPVVLAIVLALLSAGGIAHALVVSVRRRRRELGTLQALGFTPRQVRRVVGRQATTIVLVALVVGLPVGVMLGRQAWSAVATQLGVVNHPLVPWSAMAVVSLSALIVVNLVALLPSRSATRVVPAQALRDE